MGKYFHPHLLHTEPEDKCGKKMGVGVTLPAVRGPNLFGTWESGIFPIYGRVHLYRRMTYTHTGIIAPFPSARVFHPLL